MISKLATLWHMRSKTVVATLFAPKKFHQCSFYLCSKLLYHLNQYLEKPVPMFLLSASFSCYFYQWDTPRLNSSKGHESFTHSSSTPLPMKRKSSKNNPLQHLLLWPADTPQAYCSWLCLDYSKSEFLDYCKLKHHSSTIIPPRYHLIEGLFCMPSMWFCYTS